VDLAEAQDNAQSIDDWRFENDDCGFMNADFVGFGLLCGITPYSTIPGRQ
jgi:hypothetical protein